MCDIVTEETTSIIIQGTTVFPVKIIGRGKFPVMLFTCEQGINSYAVKVFPYQHHLYFNEERFAFLDHPNISSPIQVQELFSPVENSKRKFSISIQEFLPHKDLFSVLLESRIRFDEILVRTYFHQLIHGLEYLHNQGIAHLDLKLENLMIDKDFKLKIIDFDLAHKRGDLGLKGMGTVCYRAPELLRKKCTNPQAADIYSAGILLFVMKSGRNFPHCEHNRINGTDLQSLLEQRPDDFWVKHTLIQGEGMNFWGEDFRKLFCGMTQAESEKRFAIAQIKNSAWYQGEIYSDETLYQVMKCKFSDANLHEISD